MRALVVNVGVYEHFAASLGGLPELSAVPRPIIALTLFVLPFSFAIAVLKDVPDAKGDRHFQIATFTVRLGARRAVWMGLAALTGGYVGLAVLAWWLIAIAGGEGLMFEPGDVAAMSRHITALMDDDELCRALGGRGLARIASEFTPETHLSKLEQAYEVALMRSPRPAGT